MSNIGDFIATYRFLRDVLGCSRRSQILVYSIGFGPN